MPKYYAVARGRHPGIYKTWDEAKKQTHDYPRSLVKGFTSMKKANEFITKCLVENETHDVNPECFRIATISCCNELEEKTSEYRYIWIMPNLSYWLVYWEFKNMLEYGKLRKPMGSMRMANMMLFIRALKTIHETERIPNEKWVIMVNDEFFPRMLLQYAPKWEQTGYLTSEGKEVKYKNEYMEARRFMRAISDFGIQVVINPYAEFSGLDAHRAINTFTNKIKEDRCERVVIDKKRFVVVS